MLIGVVSDTHNNLKNIDKIISLFNEEKVNLVIHTGDIASAKALEKFSTLESKLVGVYGNNDRSELGIQKVVEKHDFTFQEPPKLLSINKTEIAIFHEPEIINNFIMENKNTRIVLHGHTHRYRNEIKNGILYFNPGESAGMQKGKNAIGIVNLETLEAKRIFF